MLRVIELLTESAEETQLLLAFLQWHGVKDEGQLLKLVDSVFLCAISAGGEACQHPRKSDHTEKPGHLRNSHGNGCHWEDVDKMETEDESLKLLRV